MTKLIAFNKPYGVVCQFGRHEKHPSLKQFIPVPTVYPAGRLDTDSEGLLLLTDDGSLQAAVTSPASKTVKTYWAQAEGSPDADFLHALSRGVDLGDFVTRPAQVRILEQGEADMLWERVPPIRVRRHIPDFWVELHISEGKNRQVRRMCAKAGRPCLRLVRVAVGDISLFDLGLQPGQWSDVSSAAGIFLHTKRNPGRI